MGIKIESINGLCNIINVYFMKTFYIIAILFLLTFFASCETVSIQFTESQPSHKTKRSKIPKRMHGYYLGQGNGNKSENKSLRISEQSIVLYRTESITASKAEIFKELGREVGDDSLIIIANNKFENVQVSFIKHTDSVNLIIPENDTLFVFQENYALIKYKNKWFINQKTAQSNWTTTVLWRELNSIYLSDLVNSSQIDSLGQIFEIDSIGSNSYLLHPDKKHIKQILNKLGTETEYKLIIE